MSFLGVMPFGVVFYLGGVTYAGLALDLNPFVVTAVVSAGATLGKAILLILCHARFLDFVSRRG
jgi:hypothetical protein